MKPKYSKKDSRGNIQVACCECKRGGNGEASCSCGWKTKRWNQMACFSGELLEKFDAGKLQIS